MALRSRVAATVLAMTVAFLAACGSDQAEPDGTVETSAGSSEGTFPVTVEHKFGETLVSEEQQRVVSVGPTEHEVLLQLAVFPVGVTEGSDEQSQALWPWARDLLEGAEPEVLSLADGFEYEKIAALSPDLIIGTNAGMSKADYDLLSDIAPTVPGDQDAPDRFVSWQDRTLQVARAVGREEEGEQIIEDSEQAYAKVAAEHPEWDGQTATFSQGEPVGGILSVYPTGPSTSFLSELGFAITTGVQKFAPESGAPAEISASNVGVIDADVIVFATAEQAMFERLQEFGSISSLAAVQENRAIYTDKVLAGALSSDTPLARAYVLEKLTPLLEQATAGKAPRGIQP